MRPPLLLRAQLLWQANELLGSLYSENIMLQHEKRAAELAYMRISRDLIEQFLIALDQPENHDQIRDRLTCSLGCYRDEIAILEEHV